MKLHRTDLIRALETALGPAELGHEHNPNVAFLAGAGGLLLLRGQTDEAAGWDAVASDEPLLQPFLAPGRPILQALKEIRQEMVELERREQELHLLAGSYCAVIWTRPVPAALETSSRGPAVAMSSNVLGHLGSLVAYARPKGRNKSVFPGIHLLLGPEGVRIVATDGRRLALATAAEPASAERLSAILPGRFLLLAARHVEHDAAVELVFGDRQLELRQGSRGIAGTVLSGPMPSYKALLPGEAHHSGRLRRARLAEAIRQARLFSPRVLLQLDEDKLYLSTPETPEGQAEISIGVEWPGPLFRAHLNTDELLEALENLPDDEITVEVQGERNPLVLRSSVQALATLMPLLW